MWGWLKLYRQMCNWEWYQDSHMVHLFIHLLINANHEDGEWQGVKIKRGQLITGRLKLHLQTGISEQTIRTCLTRFKKSGEITIKSTKKFSIITILNYSKYQEGIKESQPTNQPANQPTTNHKQEVKEEKKKTQPTNPEGFASWLVENVH